MDEEKDYPLGFRQYFKHDSPEADKYGFRSKIQLATQLVDECERLGVAAENYVFDSWYLSQELADHIQGYGKGWVSTLKSNRIVYTRLGKMKIREWEETVPRKDFRKIEVLGRCFWAYTKVLDANKLGKVRVVVCYDNPDLDREPAYLATNKLYWEEKRVVQCYGLRFRIDSFYKDAKQNLGLGDCQLRSLKGTMRHWLLGITAYSLLKLRICRSRLYRRFKSDQTVGAECRQAFMDLLQNLVQWVYKTADKLPVNKILDVLLR